MKRGGSLSFLVGTISNVLVMEIGWTDVGSLTKCAHGNISLIRYSGHLFNVVSGHHLLVISSVKPLYNCKFIFKIIPEGISKVRYFSQMYKKS